MSGMNWVVVSEEERMAVTPTGTYFLYYEPESNPEKPWRLTFQAKEHEIHEAP